MESPLASDPLSGMLNMTSQGATAIILVAEDKLAASQGVDLNSTELNPLKTLEKPYEGMLFETLKEAGDYYENTLTIHVQGRDLATGPVLRGCMHLVYLAGSERADKSEAVRDILSEAHHINHSLSALGDAISSLAKRICMFLK